MRCRRRCRCASGEARRRSAKRSLHPIEWPPRSGGKSHEKWVWLAMFPSVQSNLRGCLNLSGRGTEGQMRQGKDLWQPWGRSQPQGTQLPDTHQPCTVVTWEVLVADLYQAPKGLLRRARTRRQGWGLEKQGVGSSPITMVCQDLLTPTPTRSTYADLRRHVHEQHSSHWGLGLTVALVRPVDGIGLQDSVQVLLPKGSAEDGNHQTCPCPWTRTLLQVPS